MYIRDKSPRLTQEEIDAIIKSINSFGGAFEGGGHPCPTSANIDEFGVAFVLDCLRMALANVPSEYHGIIQSAIGKLN